MKGYDLTRLWYVPLVSTEVKFTALGGFHAVTAVRSFLQACGVHKLVYSKLLCE